jgi:endonuclease G, mitochondrial
MRFFVFALGLLASSFSLLAVNNLKVGTPSKDQQIINRQGYAFSYSEEHEQAMWVSYELTKEEVSNKVAKRKDNFRVDPLVRDGSASLSDYRGSGYDRGHLAPAADMAWSTKAMSESFYLTNMSPQVPGLNRGMWKDLEELCRSWAVKEGKVFIITGPIIREGYKTIGSNKVSVPQWYYKVIVDLNEDDSKAIAFIIPNRKPQKKIQEFAVSIDKLEAITGLDFLDKIDDDLEKKLESQINLEKWTFKDKDYSKWIKKSSDKIVYWISGSNKRHLPSCRYYKTSKGRESTKKEGSLCKLCSGKNP